MQRSVLSLILVICSLVFTSTVQATQSDFETSLRSVYSVNATGKGKVEHQFTLTNLTPTLYVTKYAYQTSLTALEDIVVTSNGSRIDPQVVTTNDRTTISFSFPDEVVGQGRQRQFAISFSSDVFSTQAGEVLEVTIPAVNAQSAYTNHTVQLNIDKQHGVPYRLHPAPSSTKHTNLGVQYSFDPYQGEAISAVFGNEQTYLVTAEYILDNPLPTQAYSTITLPPDTSWQQVQYQSILPKPDFMQTDADGNWLAGYYLEPSGQKTVTAIAYVTVALQPNTRVPVPPPQAEHMSSLPYWQSDHPEILQVARQTDSVQAIYDTVVSSLQYTKSPLTYDRKRYGAILALANADDAVCQEFTDLFVALSRANGVPARRVTGYAYTLQPEIRPLSLDGDILHAWPEFFDAERQIWQPVDPTWESTTGGVDYFNFFDLNHIAFAMNGVDSSLPAPAGSYKPVHDPQAQTVQVTLSDKPPAVAPKFSVDLQPQSFGPFSIPGWYNVVVSNQTGQAWYGVSYDIQATATDAEWKFTQPQTPSTTMLPYMTDQQSVLVTTTGLLPEQSPLVVAIQLTDGPTYYAESQESYLIVPSIFTSTATYLILGGCLTICTLTAGSVLVWRQRRNTSLRWQSQEPQG